MEHEIGAFRSDNPDTSVAAAVSVNATKLEALVLADIGYSGDYGATGAEISNQKQMGIQTISPRFAPLVRKGLIHDSGLRRKGNSNRKQIVWKLGPKPEAK